MIYLILIFTVFFLFVPSVDTAVILTVLPLPAFFVFTTPLEVTVAYFVSELVHFKVLFTFFPVVLTVAFTLSFFPALTVFAAFSFTLLTAFFIILIL